MVLTVCVVRYQLNATINQTKHISQLTNISIKNSSIWWRKKKKIKNVLRSDKNKQRYMFE
jgi:hypothetical protein